MTRPLTTAARAIIEQADDLPVPDPERMRMQVDALLDAYPMAEIRLAQFLAEVALGLQGVLERFDDKDLREGVRGYLAGTVMLASAVSRRPRGKAEV